MSAKETEKDTFDLSVQISNPELVEWLGQLPEEDFSNKVEGALLAGNFVLNLVQATTGEEQMGRFFRPVTEKMNDLKDTLDSIIKRAHKSQRIGEIGEEIVTSQLRDAFPGDTFDVVSAAGHETDIEATFDIGRDEAVKARVEVKLYSNDVPGKELVKFREDLTSTRAKYGLMVSLSSRLMGMKGALRVEETDDYTAVFVSNAGLDGVQLVAATAMLKAIMLYHQRADEAQRVPVSAIENAWARINDEIEEIRAVANTVENFRDIIRAAQTDFTAQMNDLADQATEVNIRLQNSVARLTGRIHDEMLTLPLAGGEPRLLPPDPPDKVLETLERLYQNKDPRASTLQKLFDLSREHGIDVAVEDDVNWSFLLEGREIANTSVTKTRVDMAFQIENKDEVSVAPGVEKISKGKLVTSGKDPDVLLQRTAVHFRENQ